MAAPKEPRIDKTYTYGSFKSSIKDLNAPLIYLLGGLGEPVSTENAPSTLPGVYMWGVGGRGAYKNGFNRCADFNVYNINKVVNWQKGSPGGSVDTTGIKSSVAECKKILSDNGINPTKKIIVAFSKGCELYRTVIEQFGGWNQFDYVLIGGVYSKTGKPVFRSVPLIADDLKKYPNKVYYFGSDTKGDGDGTSPQAWQILQDAAAKGHITEKPYGNTSHSGLPNAMATWILDNVSVNKTAQSSNPPQNPVTSGTQGTAGTFGTNGTDGNNGTDGTQGNNEGGGGGQDGDTPQGTDGTAGTSGEPVTSGNDCGDLTKLEAKKKADNAPEGAPADVKANDPLPPPKNAAPVSSDSKYNHRFYLVPLKDNQPMSLADMVKKENKYHTRYWAWRPDEGRGFGNQKFEYTVTSDTGISLMAGLVPYWPPPKDNTDNDTLPKINGEWANLIGGQKNIESFLDIPILLNAYDVGVYNNNIEYVFEAGNELHMTLINSSLVRNKGSKLAIGVSDNTDIVEKNKKDSSWRHWPKWSGIWVSHCLKKSGYALHANIEGNIDNYHREILKKDKLINYPGNKEWKWKQLDSAGTQDLIFKPSKIWLDPTNLNSEELIKDSGEIAILIPDFHFTKDGQITEKGKKVIQQIIKLKWKLGIISAVKHHTNQSNQIYAEVLTYLDEYGKIITIGGNTTPKGADSSVSQGHHIAIKDITLKDFAQIANDTWVNGAIFISNVKSAPEGHREGGIDSKLYVSSIFKDYYERIDKEPGKLTSRMYDILQPYMSLKPANPAPEPKKEGESLQEKFEEPQGTGTINFGNKDAAEAPAGSMQQAIDAGILQKIPAPWTLAGNRSYLRPGALASFLKLMEAAQSAGFVPSPSAPGAGTTASKQLQATSVFRSKDDQARLWAKQGPISPQPPQGDTYGGQYQSAGGNPTGTAPPMGYYWSGGSIGSGTKESKGGSFHMFGKAVDMAGAKGARPKNKDSVDIVTADGTKKTFPKNLPAADYWKNLASPTQKWIATYAHKFGWYPYTSEVWHIYHGYDRDQATMSKIKLL